LPDADCGETGQVRILRHCDLWVKAAAFLVADEVFFAYPVEGTHLRLFTAQLATLLAIELLPENQKAAGSR